MHLLSFFRYRLSDVVLVLCLYFLGNFLDILDLFHVYDNIINKS